MPQSPLASSSFNKTTMFSHHFTPANPAAPNSTTTTPTSPSSSPANNAPAKASPPSPHSHLLTQDSRQLPLPQSTLPSTPTTTTTTTTTTTSNNAAAPATPQNNHTATINPTTKDQPAEPSTKEQQQKQQKDNTTDSPEPLKKLKRYRCCYCDRAFSRSEHRSRHERSHTKERPFHCSKCPSTFVRRDLLLRHDRTVHAKSPKQPATASTATTPATTTASKSDSPIFVASPLSPTPADHKDQKDPKDLKEKPKKKTPAPAKAKKTTKKKNSDINALLNQTPASPAPATTTTPATPIKASASPQPHHLPPTPPTAATPPPVLAATPVRPSQSPTTADFSTSLNALARAASADSHESSEKRKRNNDEELNAALLMTELHQSLTRSPSEAKRQKLESPLLQHPLPVAPPARYSPAQYSRPLSYSHFYPPPAQGTFTPQLGPAFQVSHIHQYFNTPPAKLRLPSKLQLNRYLATYFLFFHPILPFLHLHTFDPAQVAPPLLLSVCSVGALLCHEQPMSAFLYGTAKRLVLDTLDQKVSAPWVTHALILQVVYSAWNDTPGGLAYIESIRSVLVSLVTSAVDSLRSASMHAWSDFIDAELTTRAYFATYIVFGSITSLYNIKSPSELDSPPEGIRMPCTEVFWNSAESVYAHPGSVPQGPTFKDAWESFQAEGMRGMSPMGVRVIGMAIFKQVWAFRAGNQSSNTDRRHALESMLAAWSSSAMDSNPGQGQAVSQFLLNASPLSLTLSMDDCLGTDSMIVQKVRTLQHPLILDAWVVSVVSGLRLALETSPLQNSIKSHAPTEISNAAQATLTHLLNQGSLANPAVRPLIEKCFDLFRLIQVAGGSLFKAVGAGSPVFVGCPEALLGLFEMMAVVAMWCRHMERSTQTDDDMYLHIERTVMECGLDYDKDTAATNGGLGPTLALASADILEACTTWGIAGVLGVALREFGEQLQQPTVPLQQQQQPSVPVISPRYTHTQPTMVLPSLTGLQTGPGGSGSAAFPRMKLHPVLGPNQPVHHQHQHQQQQLPSLVHTQPMMSNLRTTSGTGIESYRLGIK